MAPNSPARRLKRWVIAALCVLAVVLIALSPSFGRAKPTGEYRPPLPPDALKNGCYPLPEGVELDFSYQVRTDGDVGGRRILVLQYNLIDLDEAVRSLVNSFLDAGYTRTGDEPADLRFEKPGSPDVFASATPLSPLKDDQLVRGTIQLDLPIVARQSDDPVCSNVESTKRFAESSSAGADQ